MADKRFEVSIKLDVKEKVAGDAAQLQEFFETEVLYHDLPIEGLLAVEVALGEAVQRLTRDGIERAVTKGAVDKDSLARLLGQGAPAKK